MLALLPQFRALFEFPISCFHFPVSSFQFLLQNPLNVRRVDFHRRRPRNQVQRQHHPTGVLLPDKVSFHPRQRPALDAYPGSNTQIRMRFDPRPVQNSLAKTFDFALRKRIRLPIKSHQPHDARNFQNSQTRAHRNTNKHVAREERQFELHAPVFPTPHRSVQRKEMLDIPCFKVLYYALLMIRAGIRGKPVLFAMACTGSWHRPGNERSCCCCCCCYRKHHILNQYLYRP